MSIGIGLAAVLNTAAALSMPAGARRPSSGTIMIGCALLLTHAIIYWFGERVRQRWGLIVYVLTQSAVLFAITAARVPIPVVIGVYVAATAELVLLADRQWRATWITGGMIVLFLAASLVTSGLYQAAAAGVALSITGVVAHAIGALKSRKPEERVVERAPPFGQVPGGAEALSPREREVLRELIGGARNSDIAARLGISERTVKSHLKSIFQKLGVQTRSAAVSAALHRKLI